MRLTALARAVGAVTAATMFAAPAAVFAAPAYADEMQDDYFVEFLDKKGVPYEKRVVAVRTAKSTCLKVSRPGDPGAVGYSVAYDLKEKMGFTNSEAATFVEGSIYVYCPQVYGIEQEE